MAKKITYLVNFGTRKGGLATVGYTVYKKDGTLSKARSTDGVVEIGTSTGIYTAPIAIEEDSDAIVLWDTGDATILYSTEEYRSQLNTIQGETEHIRLIWNTLRNQGEVWTKLIDDINKLYKKMDNLDNVVAGLDKRNMPKKEDFEKSIKAIEKNVTQKVSNLISDIKMPEMPEIPEFPKIPEPKNYMPMLRKLESLLSRPKDYTANFKNVLVMLNEIQANLAKNMDDKSKVMREHTIKLQGIFARFEGVMSKISDLKRDMLTLDDNDSKLMDKKKDLEKEIKGVNELIASLTKLLSHKFNGELQQNHDITMSFGHLKGKK